MHIIKKLCLYKNSIRNKKIHLPSIKEVFCANNSLVCAEINLKVMFTGFTASESCWFKDTNATVCCPGTATSGLTIDNL